LKEELESKNEMTVILAESKKSEANIADLKSKKKCMGRQGIKRNAFHRILRLEEVGKEFRFAQIRNFWGAESNWVGLFSPNSLEWEKFKDVKAVLQERTGEIFK
jgi:hypothetical protein